MATGPADLPSPYSWRAVEQSAPREPFRWSVPRVTLFLFTWLAVGFSMGTSTLLGPVRWVATLSRRLDWGEPAEAKLVWLVIALFVGGSAAVALWLTRLAVSSPRWEARYGVPALAWIAALGALWLWLNPSVLRISMGEETTAGGSFTFGPYPTEERMRELKREGYSAVLSLLHPAVVPFEPKLLADEKVAAKKTGLRLIHIPLLPWISENTESLDRIKELARHPRGRIYVHCYLGMDRVHLVKRIVELAGSTALTDAVHEVRSLRGKKSLERGEIASLGGGSYLIPYPTDDEFVRYVLGGSVVRVVSLLDPRLESQRGRLEHERRLLERYEMPLESIPLAEEPYDPAAVLAAARRVRGLPGPLVVHHFFGPLDRRGAIAQAFLQAYLGDEPPLRASLFVGPLARGRAEVVASHIAEPSQGQLPAGTRSPPGDAEAASATDGAGAAAQAEEPAAQPSSGLREGEARPGSPAEFVARLVPDARTIILLGPILLLVSSLAGVYAGWLRLRREVRAPFTRKVFHFSIFTTAGVLHVAGGLPAVSLFGGIVSLLVLYAVFRGDGFPLYEALARPTDHPHRTLFIVVPLVTTAAGGLAANLLFGSFAVVGYLVGGWGDAVGEPVGSAWGRIKYRVPSLAGVPAVRTLEGSTAVTIVGAAAAVAGLLAWGASPATAFGVGALCGVAGAAAEAVSHHGLDNLTIQVTASGVAYWLLA